MKDYNQPPTEEFAFKEKSPIMGDLNGWFTMMKCVMNDYWFDIPAWDTRKIEDTWMDPEYVDHFMHKMYFCWMQMGIHLHGHDPRVVEE